MTLQSILNELQSNVCLINNWEQGDKIGDGSFGVVYTCINREDSKEIAGKYIRIALPTVTMLPKEKVQIKKDIEPVLKECNIMMKLDHERVVKCFGVTATDAELVIFTELMENGSVYDELHRRLGAGLDLKSTIKYLRQATEGLLYIHKQGIFHRDLKCQNLLLDDRMNVKLADFGLSVEIRLKNGATSSTFTENGKGAINTLLHMAPEAQQRKTFTRKSDIWSMGCTVVEMLNTISPHEETTEDWGEGKFIEEVGNGNLKYIGHELCPEASVEIQVLLDNIFQPAQQRITTEQLLIEATILFVTVC